MKRGSGQSLVLALFVAACGGELDWRDPGGDEGDEDPVAYRPRVQADLDALGCSSMACHGGGTLPMVLAPHPSTGEEWLANYQEVLARAGTVTTSTLLEKATGAGGHVAALSAGDAIHAAWSGWIASGAPYEPPAAAGLADGGGGGGDGDAGAGADAGSSAAVLTWDDDVAPMLAANDCGRCHGTSGGYSLAGYADALGDGSDSIPNVIPGDPLSLLVQYGEDGHQGMPYQDALLLVSWVVDSAARRN